MNADLELALQLADLADSIALPRFRAADLVIDPKQDGTPVTDADRRAEDAIRDALRRARPSHAVRGEEFGDDGTSEWRWFVDPIDGTKNFARGVPVWATLIALRRADEPLCGVVSAPALGRRWWAARGGGAHAADGSRLRVSSVASLASAYLSCTDPRDFAARGCGAQFERLVGACGGVRGFGDFWSHMLVAEGALDIGIEPVVEPWDVAAVQVIVEEAGGRFSDFDGRSRIDTGSVITTNGLVHDDVVALISGRP